MSAARFIAVLLVPMLMALAACDDPNNPNFEPRLVADTVLLAVPDPSAPLSESVGSALDIGSSSVLGIAVREPERPSAAGQYDVLLRRRGNELVLVPPKVLGVQGMQARAGIATVNGSFDQVREIPQQSSFVTDSVIPLRPSTTYVLRSRDLSCGFGRGNIYAKLEPLELNPAAGTARLNVVANSTCNDPRLVPES